jgi:hypothetical protein
MAGEIFVLPSTEPVPLGRSHDIDAARAEEVFARSRVGGAAVHNGSGDVFLAGRRFVVNGRHAEVRLYASIIPLRAAGQAALCWLWTQGARVHRARARLGTLPSREHTPGD